MDYRKCILFLFLYLINLNISANRVIPVGAIVETDTHIWLLDTIWTSERNSYVLWTVKSKKSDTGLVIDKDFKLIDCKSGNIYRVSDVRVSKESTLTFCPEDKVYMHFPGVPDSSSLLSIYLSPSFYVDSISTFMNTDHILEYRYHVPLYNYPEINNTIDSVKYIDYLYNEGIKEYNQKNYCNAILSFEKELAIEYQLFKTFAERLIKSSSTEDWLAHCYYKTGDISKAIKYGRDYSLMPYDRNKTKEADSLRYLAFSSNEHPETLIPLYERICKLNLINLGSASYHYIESLYELGSEYYRCKDYKKANDIYYIALNNLTQNYNKDIQLYKDVFEGLADVAAAKGDFYTAAKYMEKSIMVMDTLRILDDDGIFTPYKKLVEYYANAGMWDKALDVQKQKVDYWEKKSSISVQNEETYYFNFSRWVQLLSLSGNYKKAIREIRKFINETPINILYVDLIKKRLADSYYILRDYQSAFDVNNKIGNKYGIARTLIALGNYEMAIRLLKELIEDVEDKHFLAVNLDFENPHGQYDTYLCDMAYCYNKIEQFDSALECEHKHRMPNRTELAKSYYNIGNAYLGKKQLDSAIYYLQKAKEIYEMQHQNKQCANVLGKLLFCYMANSSYYNLDYYIYELIKSVSEDLISTFQELTYDERSRYIEEYSDILNRQIPIYAYYTQSDSIIEMAYDASLMLKGALLNSENSVKRVIEESKDTSLKDLWEEMKADRYILNKQLGKDSLERKLDTDSLKKVIYNLEDALIMKCKEYDDITKSMRFKWYDIQKHLSPRDAAIEYLRIPINNDSVMYVALALRGDYENPKMISLFEEKQLKQVPDTIYYQCKAMTDLVWKPLLHELEGIKNIYFAPSGALYNIGIEFLPGMEEYNINRLSSTRELITKKGTKAGNSAVLYGGLDYYAEFDTLNRRQATQNFTFSEHANVRSMNIRGGKEFLPHTMNEIKQIGSELNNAKWKCILDTLSIGTEDSFKSLSGKGIKTLHIATHGFYYTPEEADNIGYDFLMMNNNMVSSEDKSLSRSGLLMAGANHILEGEDLPENVEDGILTAKEIADVDLRGLDLVVLSACQTGLGDISQGEGVFGLQRGFKKAGAKSILMSLWEVDDKATQIFMVQFYRNLLSGKSKRQSLSEAQSDLRKYGNGKYNDPKYWAAFILLDGLD